MGWGSDTCACLPDARSGNCYEHENPQHRRKGSLGFRGCIDWGSKFQLMTFSSLLSLPRNRKMIPEFDTVHLERRYYGTAIAACALHFAAAFVWILCATLGPKNLKFLWLRGFWKKEWWVEQAAAPPAVGVDRRVQEMIEAAIERALKAKAKEEEEEKEELKRRLVMVEAEKMARDAAAAAGAEAAEAATAATEAETTATTAAAIATTPPPRVLPPPGAGRSSLGKVEGDMP